MKNRLLLVTLSSVALLAPLACRTQTSLPDAYLGRWYYVGTSGGIAGDIFGEPDGTSIVISGANEIESYDANGALVGSTSFEPTLGSSIFSAGEDWILEEAGPSQQVMILSEDGQTMALSDNVYDGFSTSYRRTR
jgi:hypothetical protein